MEDEKKALIETIERARQQIVSVSLEDVDQLDILLSDIQKTSAALLQEGNPYRLAPSEIEALKAAYAEITEHARQLADMIVAQTETLRQKGTAAASYLKHS